MNTEHHHTKEKGNAEITLATSQNRDDLADDIEIKSGDEYVKMTVEDWQIFIEEVNKLLQKADTNDLDSVRHE